MNEQEANFENARYGSKGFDYDAVDGVEPKSDISPDVRLSIAAIELYELQMVRSAMKLTEYLASWSRTPGAGRLRMMAAQNLIFGEPGVDEIAFRMKVSKRRVWQVIREVRGHCEPFLKFHHRRRSKFPRIKKF